MEQAKHTPGPWWATDTGVRDAGGYICGTRPAQRYEGQDERFEREKAERLANKNLIAAAPDLLEALISLENAYCDVGPNMSREDRISGRKALAKARAAIARATHQGE